MLISLPIILIPCNWLTYIPLIDNDPLVLLIVSPETVEPSLPLTKWMKPFEILEVLSKGIKVSWRSITNPLSEILPIFKISPATIPESGLIWPSNL